MKANRKTMLIAAFAVAVIALAGVGYATAGIIFTGKTTSSSQNLENNNIVLKISETGAYTTNGITLKAYYNTNTSYSASEYQTTYKFNTSDTITYTLTADKTGTATASYALTFTYTDFTIDGATYKWQLNGVDLTKNVTTGTATVSGGTFTVGNDNTLTLVITSTDADCTPGTITVPAITFTLSATTTA